MSQKLLPYEEQAFIHQRRKELFYLHNRKNLKKKKKFQVRTAYKNKSNDILLITYPMYEEEDRVVFLKPFYTAGNKFNHRNSVKCAFRRKNTKIAAIGTIIDVIPYGETIQMEEPVYTILVEDENSIYKYVRESSIMKYI